MNLFILAWNYLKAKPLTSFLTIFLLSLGVALITILLLLNNQLEEKITSNSRNISLVVGAKGSPLQLVLCNIFHVDFPTGNILLKDADKLAHHRMVKLAVPLSLGDSYSGFRIIGTTMSYAKLYELEIGSGEWFKKEMDVVIGTNVQEIAKLKIGDVFKSAHGLSTEGDDHHAEYRVVGVLKPNHTVVDNLILTPIESIWHVHDDAEDSVATSPSDEHYNLVPSVSKNDSLKQITAMLIVFGNPMAELTLPRLINAQTNMQAASPAYETTRLFSILGIGVDVIIGFAYVLVFISALSIFIALYNSLKERQYDLAILRTMGASRFTLFVTVTLEGSMFTVIGSLLGILLGHAVMLVFVSTVSQGKQIGIDPFQFYSQEAWIVAGSIILGFICSAIPAIQAYRTDIHKVLAGN